MHRSFTLLFLTLIAAATTCLSQVNLPRFEIGTQATVLRTYGQTDRCGTCAAPQLLAGPAATYNVSRHFAIDAAFSFAPGRFNNPSHYLGGHVTETLIGIKASVHGSRFSVFAKMRPGYVRWSRGVVSNLDYPNMTTVIKDGVQYVDMGAPVYSYKPRTNLAVDLGGGVQYAFMPTLSVRAEMGDTVMRWHHDSSFWEPPAPGPVVSNNVQFSTAVLYRFGTPIVLEKPARDDHRFFDRTNLTLISASWLAQTADAITTQRFMANCRNNWVRPPNYPYGCEQKESNPLARPFVPHGWGGQIALGAIVNTVQTSVIYALHRMGHHRIERFVTVPLTVGSGVMAYKNLQ